MRSCSFDSRSRVESRRKNNGESVARVTLAGPRTLDDVDVDVDVDVGYSVKLSANHASRANQKI